MGHSHWGGGGHSGGNNLAVVTNHLLGQDGLGGGLLAGGGDDLLTVLGVHGVHDLVILLVTDLARGLNLPGHTLQLRHRVALRGGHRHGLVAVKDLRVGIGISFGLSLDGGGDEAHGEYESKHFHLVVLKLEEELMV